MLAAQFTAETAVLLFHSSKTPALEQRRFIPRRTLKGSWTAQSTVLQKTAQNCDQVIERDEVKDKAKDKGLVRRGAAAN